MTDLYAVNFRDRRDRRHVVIVKAASVEESIQKVVDFATDRMDFYYDILPKRDDVVKIKFMTDEQDPTGNDIHIVWHEDYD
jgi:hypothetical protein